MPDPGKEIRERKLAGICIMEGMKLTWRTAAAVIILALSLALLIWGFWPMRRERLVVPVDPSNLTLPTPSSFSPVLEPFAYLKP